MNDTVLALLLFVGALSSLFIMVSLKPYLDQREQSRDARSRNRRWRIR